MIQFTLNKKKVKFPSTWYDLTFDQYVKCCKGEGTVTNFISWATGIDPEKVKTMDITGLEALIVCLDFLNKAPKFEGVVTQVGPFKLPLNSKGEFNIQFETLAQFEDLRILIEKSRGKKDIDFIMMFPEYVSIYVQKIRDGKYNPDAAKAMVSEIMTYPAHEVVSAGSFFFVKLVNLLNGTAQTYLITAQSPKKKKQASVKSPKSSGRYPRSSK